MAGLPGDKGSIFNFKQPSGPAVRLLIVEDDAEPAAYPERTLVEKSDHTAEVVHLACLATTRLCLRNSQFDLILLDLPLPDSQGLDSDFRAEAAPRLERAMACRR